MDSTMSILMEFLFSLAIALWIYGDAKNRRLYNALTWGIGGFLFGLIGLAVYYFWVIRPNKTHTKPRWSKKKP